jgi:hypothetical protein
MNREKIPIDDVHFDVIFGARCTATLGLLPAHDKTPADLADSSSDFSRVK